MTNIKISKLNGIFLFPNKLKDLRDTIDEFSVKNCFYVNDV